MSAPGYSLDTASTAASGIDSNLGFNSSGFNVNFGGAGGVNTDAVPPVVWLALAGVVAWILLKVKV